MPARQQLHGVEQVFFVEQPAGSIWWNVRDRRARAGGRAVRPWGGQHVVRVAVVLQVRPHAAQRAPLRLARRHVLVQPLELAKQARAARHRARGRAAVEGVDERDLEVLLEHRVERRRRRHHARFGLRSRGLRRSAGCRSGSWRRRRLCRGRGSVAHQAGDRGAQHLRACQHRQLLLELRRRHGA
eukprot:2558894-Prymnesium_polylepis.1